MYRMKNNRTKTYYSRANNHKDVLRWLLAIILVMSVMTCAILNSNAAEASAETPKKAAEYQIKAIYLYNFLLFTEWPRYNNIKGDTEEKLPAITIGILGRDPFGDSFAEVEGKVIKSHKKRLVIKKLGSYDEKLDLTQCDLLFICQSEKDNLKEIVVRLSGLPVLTVADLPGFLERGGMINLVKRQKKVRWEINQGPVKKARLKLSSQLLRNAVRIVKASEPTSKETEEAATGQ